MKNNKEILSDILAHLDNLSHIHLDKKPGRQSADKNQDQQLC